MQFLDDFVLSARQVCKNIEPFLLEISQLSWRLCKKYELSKMAKWRFAQSTGGPPVRDLEQSFNVEPSRMMVNRPIRSIDMSGGESFRSGFDMQSSREILVTSAQYILKITARCSNSLFVSVSLHFSCQLLLLQCCQQRRVPPQQLIDSYVKWTVTFGSFNVSDSLFHMGTTYRVPMVENSVTE